jgi:hypothetical protein
MLIAGLVLDVITEPSTNGDRSEAIGDPTGLRLRCADRRIYRVAEHGSYACSPFFSLKAKDMDGEMRRGQYPGLEMPSQY